MAVAVERSAVVTQRLKRHRLWRRIGLVVPELTDSGNDLS